MRYRLKHVVEYAVLRAFGGFLRLLPYRAALAAGAGIAWFGHHVLRFRRAEAGRRIRSVLGPERPEAEIRRIAWTSWRNLCFNVVELARLPEITHEWANRHVDSAALKDIIEHVKTTGKGAIIATPHAGNWDLCGIACHLLGIPIFFIARRQKNPLTDAHLNRMRGVTGIHTLLSDNYVLRHLMRSLKSGEVLAILSDVRTATGGDPVPFLGGQAFVGSGLGLFALHAGVPVFTYFAIREGWSRHRIIALRPVIPDPKADRDAERRRVMVEVMSQFDEMIRRHPEQYFWYNKRWVLDPVE